MNPAQALTTTRLLWAAMLSGQLVLLGVIALLMAQGTLSPADPQLTTTLFLVSLGAIVTAVPAGYFARSQIYKKHWQRESIEPRGYVTGNIVLLALLEAPAMLALVTCMLAASFWPGIVVAMLALGVQIINFPHGVPMHATFDDHGKQAR